MCKYHGVTMHNDVAMNLFYYVFFALCLIMIFMAIAVASISTYAYKYVIHRIAISYAAWGEISAQIMERRHRLLGRSTLYLYLYCIYFVLLYLQSTCTNKMRVWFTILFHLKTMIATTFNTYQVWECLLGLPPSFDHNMTAPNFKSSSIQIVELWSAPSPQNRYWLTFRMIYRYLIAKKCDEIWSDNQPKNIIDSICGDCLIANLHKRCWYHSQTHCTVILFDLTFILIRFWQ